MRTESCSYLIYICYTIHNVQCQELREVSPHPIDVPRRDQPSDTDRKARQKFQEKASDFQVTFDDNVYLSLGLEAK